MVRARFFYSLEWCIRMALLSHFYHKNVVPIVCQNSRSHFALRSPAAVCRARGLQLKLFCLPNHPDWDKLTERSCTCINSSCAVRASEVHLVKRISNARKIRKLHPGGGLFLYFGQKCVHIQGKSKNSYSRNYYNLYAHQSWNLPNNRLPKPLPNCN